MWIFTEIADWFEQKRTQSAAILAHSVEESHYSQGVMIVAATAKSFTTFSAGFVDVLKPGDGIKARTLKGVGQQALRIVAIFTLGKAASLVKSAKGGATAKLVADTGGPHCFWVTSAKAFDQVWIAASEMVVIPFIKAWPNWQPPIKPTSASLCERQSFITCL